MKPRNIDRSVTVNRADGCKPYSAPSLRCLTPEAAQEMLLRHSNIDHPAVKFMLECIERLQYPKGS